jgi:hypothetical protein
VKINLFDFIILIILTIVVPTIKDFMLLSALEFSDLLQVAIFRAGDIVLFSCMLSSVAVITIQRTVVDF